MGASAKKSIRAVCLVAPGKMELREFSLPELGPRDVLVRPKAVGLCGTDFHIHSGGANYHTDELGCEIPLEVHPQVLGHEIAGLIEAVGSDDLGVAVGDQVIVDQGLNCHSFAHAETCEYCVSGDSHQCEDFAEHGITGLPGGLAEALVLPAVNVIRIESDLAFDAAALCEPLACVLHILETMRASRTRYRLDGKDQHRKVESVLVIGAGPAGLLFVQVLRKVLGFEGLLLVSEPNPMKRAQAEAFGATTIDPGQGDLRRQVLDATAGRRVELLIEASGAGPVFEDIPWLLRKQGTLLMYGYGHFGVGLETLNALQFRELIIVTATGASGGFDADLRPTIYRQSLHLIEQGLVDVASLVTHRYRGLESVPAAFGDDHQSPDYIKGVVLL